MLERQLAIVRSEKPISAWSQFRFILLWLPDEYFDLSGDAERYLDFIDAQKELECSQIRFQMAQLYGLTLVTKRVRVVLLPLSHLQDIASANLARTRE